MLKTLLTGALLLLTLMACATVAPTPARDVARAASLAAAPRRDCVSDTATRIPVKRSEEHTSELQSRGHLVCRLLLEKKKKKNANSTTGQNILTVDPTAQHTALAP